MLTATLSPDHLQFIRRLVYEHSRITIEDRKIDLVHSRLAKRLRALKLDDYDAYCQLLQSENAAAEIQQLVDVISTNHTFFFREEKHFQFLRDRAVPELAARLEAANGRLFRVWSAACSSGEEPYSIAILLNEHPRLGQGLDWRVLATDISTRILQRAALGVYDLERVRNVPDPWFRRYFLLSRDRKSGKCRVRPELQRRIDFRNLNLFQPEYQIGPPFQVIFCRNVMIYFDRESQEKLVARLFENLIPGGYLMVGHSESLLGVRHDFRMIQAAIYQRPE